MKFDDFQKILKQNKLQKKCERIFSILVLRRSDITM